MRSVGKLLNPACTLTCSALAGIIRSQSANRSSESCEADIVSFSLTVMVITGTSVSSLGQLDRDEGLRVESMGLHPVDGEESSLLADPEL
jgi:hypothetical protein